MVRGFPFLSVSLLCTISLFHQANATPPDVCPSAAQVEKVINDNRRKPQTLAPLDEIKVGVNEATKIENGYILLTMGNNERIMRELEKTPVEKTIPLYSEPLDASDPEVTIFLSSEAKDLKKYKSVCTYLGKIGTEDVPIFVGKPAESDHK
jgi:hypothetical protein